VNQTVQEIPTLTWDDFYAMWRTEYKQSEHVTVIGPTGCGKTTLVTKLIEPRGHVVAFGVKFVDETFAKLVKKDGWARVKGSWKSRPKSAQRVALWPNESDLDKVVEVHNKIFGDALKEIYRQGHWTVWMDELTYLADHVGLKKLIRRLYILARSNRISLVGSAQRPAFIPLEAYNQATHLFLFYTGHETDLLKLGSFNGTSARQVATAVATLPEHYFLHVNAKTRRQVISTCPV